jgi:hypothetical protein
VEANPLGSHGRADFIEELKFGKGAISREILEAAGRIDVSAAALNFRQEAFDLTGNFACVFELRVTSIDKAETERLGGAD